MSIAIFRISFLFIQNFDKINMQIKMLSITDCIEFFKVNYDVIAPMRILCTNVLWAFINFSNIVLYVIFFKKIYMNFPFYISSFYFSHFIASSQKEEEKSKRWNWIYTKASIHPPSSSDPTSFRSQFLRHLF